VNSSKLSDVVVYRRDTAPRAQIRVPEPIHFFSVGYIFVVVYRRDTAPRAQIRVPEPIHCFSVGYIFVW
jgi:hypothetical protein